GIRAQVEEAERILGMQIGCLFDEGAPVDERRDPRPSPHDEVMAALRADPERSLELVIAVVRVTVGAGVRVLRWRSRLVVGLDGDVDLGHVASLDLPRAQRVAPRSEPQSGGQPLDLLDVRGLRGEARQARPDDGTALADSPEHALELCERGAARL